MTTIYRPTAGDRVIITRRFPDGATSHWTGVLESYDAPDEQYPCGGGTIRGVDAAGKSIHTSFAASETLWRVNGIVQTVTLAPKES